MKKESLALALAFATAPAAAAAHAVIDLTPPAYAAGEAQVASVEARYRETGKLLALVPVTFSASARAYAAGGVELDYPWYSFLTVDKREKLESELGVAVDSALRRLGVGTVTAAGESRKESFSPEEAAAVSEAMRQVLEENFGPQADVD